MEALDGYRIREARTFDKEAIAGLWIELIRLHRAQDARFTLADDAERVYARHAQEMIRSRDGCVLVAQEKETGQIIGFVMGDIQNRPAYSQAGRYGFLSDIFVRPEYRQRGIGTALFAEIRRWLVSRKADAIQLFAAEANPAALAFWESLGMKPFLRLYHLELPTSE